MKEALSRKPHDALPENSDEQSKSTGDLANFTRKQFLRLSVGLRLYKLGDQTRKKWRRANSQKKADLLEDLLLFFPHEKKYGDQAFELISETINVPAQELKRLRRLARLPRNIWPLVNGGYLCEKNFNLLFETVGKISGPQIADFINHLTFALDCSQNIDEEGALRPKAFSESESRAREAEIKEQAFRNSIGEKFMISDTYVVDMSSPHANDCAAVGETTLRWLPFETEGYDEFLSRFGKDKNHILFYDAEYPRRVFCLHHEAVINPNDQI